MTNENEVVNSEVTTQPQRSPSALEDVEQKLKEKETEQVVEEKQPEPSPEPVKEEEHQETEPPKAGDKTDPNLLLKSLQEERERRRADEERIKQLEEEIKLKESASDDEVFSDEGKALQKEIKEARSEIATLKQENAKKELLIKHPDMSEHWEEFETFRDDPENKGMNLNTAAKAFRIEKGLLEPTRKGLEKPTGGDKMPSNTGKMSAEDVKILRTTNHKKYMDMLTKGQIPDKLT